MEATKKLEKWDCKTLCYESFLQLQHNSLHLPKSSVKSRTFKTTSVRGLIEKLREVTELPIWVEQPKWCVKTMPEPTNLGEAGAHDLR